MGEVTNQSFRITILPQVCPQAKAVGCQEDRVCRVNRYGFLQLERQNECLVVTGSWKMPGLEDELSADG